MPFSAVFRAEKCHFQRLLRGRLTDGVPAGVAELGVPRAVAAGAVGAAAAHDVALPPQRPLAFKAAEVAQVPADALRLRALRR